MRDRFSGTEKEKRSRGKFRFSHFLPLPSAWQPLLVAIVGGSGAGKTWLADKLQQALGSCAARISLDDFYRDRSGVPSTRRGAINFDHPRSIDWAMLERVLRDCLAGKTAELPCYDFKTHCRSRRVKKLRPRKVVLVDGLWLLRRPSLRRLFGLRIVVDCPARTRLRRRIMRDARSRGRSRASVLRQFRETVEPMHRRFVAPQIRWADIVLKNCDERDAERLAEHLRARAGRR